MMALKICCSEEFIGKGTVVKGSVVKGSVVHEDCLVMGGCRIKGAKVRDCILGKDCVITKDVRDRVLGFGSKL